MPLVGARGRCSGVWRQKNETNQRTYSKEGARGRGNARESVFRFVAEKLRGWQCSSSYSSLNKPIELIFLRRSGTLSQQHWTRIVHIRERYSFIRVTVGCDGSWTQTTNFSITFFSHAPYGGYNGTKKIKIVWLFLITKKCLPFRFYMEKIIFVKLILFIKFYFIFFNY